VEPPVIRTVFPLVSILLSAPCAFNTKFYLIPAAGIHFALSAKNVVFVDLDSDRDVKNTLTSGKILPFEGCYRKDDGYPGLGNFNLSDKEVELVKSITVNETYTSL
jgi:hypothetical protein